MTAPKQRLPSKIGDLARSDLVTVENAILLQLGIRKQQ
jgi:hypothetical protein